MDSLFQSAKEVLNRINRAGFEAYIVGGAVRDYLMKRAIHDIDVATSAPIAEIKRLFPKTIDVAIKHGTVIVRYGSHSFEVTSFRGNALVDDLRLRDFTMNAMAFASEGEIIDPYLGKDDIVNKLIRGVDNPLDRFKEDPLRMIRAIRFVSELAFKIEDKTAQAIYTCGEDINKVAVERIAVELEKIFLGKYVENSFKQFRETKLLEKITLLSSVRPALHDQRTVRALTQLNDVVEIWTYVLFLSNHQDIKGFLKQWKRSNKVISEVELILERLPLVITEGFTPEDLYFLGLQTSKKTERIRAAFLNEKADLFKIENTYYTLPIKDIKELVIKGNEIALLINKEECKSRIGELVKLIEKAVVTKKVENKKEEICRWLREEGLIDAE